MGEPPKTFHISKMLVYAASANAHFLDVSAAQDEVRDLLAALAERDGVLERIRKAVVHHKQEAALYNNEREYDCLTAVLRIIDDIRACAEEGEVMKAR